MRIFWTLMKTLTAFRNLRVRNTPQPTTLSVAYCNPAWDCCSSTTTTTTTDTLHNTSNDSDVSGSFFLQDDGEDHSQLLTLITSEIKHIQRRQRKDDHNAHHVVPLYEHITKTPQALVVDKQVLGHETVPVHHMLHPFNHFFTHLLFGMKHLFRRKNLFSLAILIAGICIANNVQAQSDDIYFDFAAHGGGRYSPSCENNDKSYSSGDDNSGDRQVTINGNSVSLNATISSITLHAAYGVNTGFFGGSGNFYIYLNGNLVASFTNVSTSCNISDVNLDPGDFDDFVNDGDNTISFTADGDYGTSQRLYHVQLTVNYSVCTPPPAPDVPEDGVKLCLDATSSALTATGDNLLWYTAPDDPTGSPDAPVPSTDNTGTTAYYVTQTVGCESDKAEIDVTVNSLPTSSVIGFTNISCFGGNDGNITVQGNDGSGSYKYSIDDGATWTASFISDAYEFMGLTAQEYKIRVKDSNGCISKEIQ
jgi:hypothetical protein